MPDNAAPPPSIMPLIAGYVPARLVFLAAELGIADLIASGTTTVEGLSQQTSMHALSLKRLLRALCAYDVFEESSRELCTSAHGRAVALRCSGIIA